MISQMEFKKDEVFKMISWTVSDCTLETFANYQNGFEKNSQLFNVVIDDCVTKWSLDLYPNGTQEESSSHLSLYLTLKEAPSDLFSTTKSVKFKLGLLRRSSDRTFNDFKTELEKTFDEMQIGHGTEMLISHDELFVENSEFTVDGKIILICEFSVFEPNSNSKKLEPCHVIASDLKRMFENDFLSDFQIETSDGEVLNVHKFILAARSPVFFAMLKNEMKEFQENSVKVADFDLKTMKEVIRFVYYDEVENLDKIAHELIYAAEKYELEALKLLCIENIIKKLSVDDVIESLLVSNLVTNNEDLFKMCLRIIICNFDTVTRLEEWKSLPNEIITKVFVEAMKILPSMMISVYSA